MELIKGIAKFIFILAEVVLIFNLLIVVHELGHFLAAKWRGLVVDKFQIWFGKPIWKKTIKGVQYGVGFIPAGGFVSLPQIGTYGIFRRETGGMMMESLWHLSRHWIKLSWLLLGLFLVLDWLSYLPSLFGKWVVPLVVQIQQM